MAPTATNSVVPTAINGVTHVYTLFYITLSIARSLIELPTLSPRDAANLLTKLRHTRCVVIGEKFIIGFCTMAYIN
ncbi:hypothetical protein CFAM422_000153 [Trichoderma lentiforme]|uniref:Uncharacterized protein n=1 Tax=Trichoderma lentiforme TaxID=1567552 RepID=A0A9P4XRW7_9HYPO|nr:hypothetical protein CFAM422_000153 [Trichoderma lentiforme]